MKLKLIFFALLGLLLSMTATADYYDKTNYIKYVINENNEAVVTSGAPRGATVILETVKENGKTYRVTTIAASVFKDNSNMTSITIPNSVTTIGESAFENCIEMTSVTVPEGVTSILRCTFQGCERLTSVTLPSTVTSIGDYAFRFGGVVDFYCYATDVVEVGENVFKSTPIGTATLHVPASALEAYQTTTPWSGFGSIVALSDEVCIDPIENGQSTMDKEAGACYTLDGQKLNGNPTTKGIFIQNRRTLLVK